jgi:aspartate racemase
VNEVASAGATFTAIPAITPHICRAQMKARASLPLVDIQVVTAQHLRARRLARAALFGTKYTIGSRLFGALEAVDVVRPRETEVDEINRIYLELETRGHCTADDEARPRLIALTLGRRDGVEALVLAGTDL